MYVNGEFCFQYDGEESKNAVHDGIYLSAQSKSPAISTLKRKWEDLNPVLGITLKKSEGLCHQPIRRKFVFPTQKFCSVS